MIVAISSGKPGSVLNATTRVGADGPLLPSSYGRLFNRDMHQNHLGTFQNTYLPILALSQNQWIRHRQIFKKLPR